MPRGSCLCGEIAFEMTGTPTSVNQCHCSRCRKTRGTGHAVNLVVALDGLTFTKGEDRLVHYQPPDARFFKHAFCGTCGSTMPRFDRGRNFAVIPMGSFDDDPGIRPTQHIFVDSKATWEEIHDDLPQFPERPPTF